jgi:allantoin racemase
MNIRVIVPVTSTTMVEATRLAYSEKARPDTVISVACLEKGPASVECFYEDALAAPQVISRAIQAERDGMDAVIIDCMNDPGMEAAREAVSIPVVGAAQSAMYFASLLAHRFSIIGTAARDVVPNEHLVRRYGLSAKYASTRWVSIPVLKLRADEEKLLSALVEEAARAVRQDGAHAIVFGCTGMRGMAAKVQERLKQQGLEVMVIDPSLAALKWAEMLADLKLAPSRRTYPRLSEAVIAAHETVGQVMDAGTPGRLQNAPNIHVLVPVTQGYRSADWLEETLRAYAAYARKGTRLQAAAIQRGSATLETRYDLAMAVPEMLRLTRKAQDAGATAVIIDCMCDPSLHAARELAAIPVIGPAQTSAFVAASLGHRFSFLASREDMEHKLVKQMEEYGIADKLASVQATGLTVQEIETNPQRLVEGLIRVADFAVREDGAHVLIPGCTGMIGIAAALQKALAERGFSIPVIEPPAAAVKLAEALSDLGLAQSKHTYPPPPKKALCGYEDLEL